MRTRSVRRILERAEQAFDRLVQGAPDNLELLGSQAAMLMEFADTYAAQGDTEKQLVSAQATKGYLSHA
jgi:hypothetical protein